MIIKYLPNPLDKSQIEYLDCIYAPVPLAALLAQIDFDTDNHIAFVNGGKVEWNFIPANDDDIIITADLAGGTNGWIGAGLIVIGTVLAVASFGTLGAGFIAAGAGLLVGSLIKPPAPRKPDVLSNSATYSFRGIENSYGEGGVMPLVYGRHKVGGAILEAYLDHRQNLTAVIALSEGEIGGIVLNDAGQPEIYINDQHISTYTADASWDFRTGTKNQSPMVLFNEGLSQIHHHYSFVDLKLTRHRGAYIHTLNNKGLSRVKVTINFPVLYRAKDSDIHSTAVSISVRASKDKVCWTEPIQKTVDDKSKSALTMDIIAELPYGATYIEITRITHDSGDFELMNDSYLKSITEIEDATISYNNTALLGLKIKPNERVSGGMPNIHSIIDGIKVCSVRKIVSGNDYTKSPSSNPADILYDILTNTRYGLGRYLHKDQIDMISLCEYAEWCDEDVHFKQYDPYTGITKDHTEKRYELNLVIDTELSAVDAMNTICKATRSIVYWHNDRLRIVMDRPSIPRQIFGMGSIVKDSYTENYIGLKDVPNQAEADFLDENNRYKKQTVSAFDSSRTDEPVNSKSVSLYGVTKYTQAKRELIFALKKARAIRRFVTFAVGIEGVICEVGDIILFSHDTPVYGYSGRVAAVDGGTVYLDRELEFNAGTRYTIIFGGGTDLIKHEFVAGTTGFTSEILLEKHNILPGTVYAAGHVTTKPIPLRILSIRQTNKFTVSFECEEYNEDVYSLNEDIIIETPHYSGLGIADSWVVEDGQTMPVPENPPGGFTDVPLPVKNIKLTEEIKQKPDGGMQINIKIDFDPSELPSGSLSRISHYAVQVAVNGGAFRDKINEAGLAPAERNNSKWYIAGTTKTNTYNLTDVSINSYYQIAVLPYTMFGTTNSTYMIEGFTPSGIISPPDTPQIISAVQNNGFITLKWQPVTNTIVNGYEVRLGKDWSFAKKVAKTKTECSAVFHLTTAGKVTYMVAAVNANGSYGVPAQAAMDIYGVEKNIVLKTDTAHEGWNGICYNLEKNRNELLLTGKSGSYTTGYIDLNMPAKTRVLIDYEIVGRYRSNLMFNDSIFTFDSADSAFAWSRKVTVDCVEHWHEISTFSGLTDDFVDVIRLAGKSESVHGIKPTVENSVSYDNGTFHKGLKRGSLKTKLCYQLKTPENAWSFYFRYSFKTGIKTGVIISLSGEDLISLGGGRYKFLSLEVRVQHSTNSELLFCISFDGTNLMLAAGDVNTGKYACTSCKAEFNKFEKIEL